MAKKQQRHIDKNKVRSFFIWLVLLLGISTLMVLAVNRKGQLELEKVLITVDKAPETQYLLTKKDVVSKIEAYLGYSLRAVTISELNLRELEAILVQDDRVKRTELYLDSDQQLHIYIEQRTPVARVKSATADYYIDDEGATIPLATARVLRVPIVTGLNDVLPDSFPNNKIRTIHNDVYEIARASHSDNFVQALVEQIHVDDNYEVWIIPKIGKEKLLLGDSNELDDRMNRLKILYREGMKRSGFNQYAELHFKWRGQVSRKGKLKG